MKVHIHLDDLTHPCYFSGCSKDNVVTFRQREGDQVLPKEGQQDVSPQLIHYINQMEGWRASDILNNVKEDFAKRIDLGIQRYGHPLQIYNGRDALRDAYEELLDAAHYMMQLLMELHASSAEGRLVGKTHLVFISIMDQVFTLQEMMVQRKV